MFGQRWLQEEDVGVDGLFARGEAVCERMLQSAGPFDCFGGERRVRTEVELN